MQVVDGLAGVGGKHLLLADLSRSRQHIRLPDLKSQQLLQLAAIGSKQLLSK
jgi:hypothetical protein